MPTTNLYMPLADERIMESHKERYRGWGLLVEISGSSYGENSVTGQPHYVPRIIVTEQLSIGFRDLEVATSHGFSTPKQCFQSGIQIARKFIDDRV